MRSFKNLMAGLVLALVACTGAFAGSDVNEVGALLVFPVVGLDPTAITITNAGGRNLVAHVSYINGDEESDWYCFECDFFVPLTPADTELLVVKKTDNGDDPDVTFYSLDTNVEHTCQGKFGMVVVTIEDALGTVTDNVLLGDSITIDEENGYAYSIPALPFQGKNGGNRDRNYQFNDAEYGRLPRIVATNFIAPADDENGGAEVEADLVLFTLGFDRQHPPRTDCSVTGFDADEVPFSRSILFGCWELFDLQELSSEFEYGSLGATACNPGPQEEDDNAQCDEHGWLSLNCRVDPDGEQVDNLYSVNGGVHGAIIQKATSSGDDQDVIGRSESEDDDGSITIELDNNRHVAWARLLFQSVTTGDAITLYLEGPAGSMLP
jgi:hypothetical protein